MSEKKFTPIEMVCEWESSPEENEYGSLADVWYGKVKWFDDKHFYGYSADGETEDSATLPITHLIIGVYVKGLGISIIRIPQNPMVAPELYRGAPNADGIYSGDFYAVMPAKVLIGNFHGETVQVNKTFFNRLGRANFHIKNAKMTLQDEIAIEELNEIGKFGLQDEFASGVYSRYDTPECIKEFINDLEDNVFPYETGEIYGFQNLQKN